jgi:hypothetical protein
VSDEFDQITWAVPCEGARERRGKRGKGRCDALFSKVLYFCMHIFFVANRRGHDCENNCWGSCRKIYVGALLGVEII